MSNAAPLTILDAEVDGARVGMRCAGGVIAALGADVAAEPGDEVIHGDGMALLPGFVNGHGHAAMTLFRGYGDDLPLMEWLETRIWPAEARLTADDVYWGTRLACLEMIRSGTVKYFDMYWHADAAGRAAQESGLRAVITPPILDAFEPDHADRVRSEALETIEALDAMDDLVQPSVGPHSIYAVTTETLRWSAATATEHGYPIQIHLAETEGEVDDCHAAHGVGTVEYVDGLGLLGPATVLAHGNWLTDDELAIVAQRGATIVTNPCSNLKLANGRIFPYAAARAAGVSLGLGTDGASSNNDLDLFEEMKFFALLQKHEARDAAAAPAAETLALARGQRSALLGGRPLAVGEPADVILVRTDDLAMTPGALDADLVYSATGHVVDTTVVAGRVLMRNRVLPDEAEVRAEVRARAARLTA